MQRRDIKSKQKISIIKSSLILIYEVINARMYKGKMDRKCKNGT